MDQGHRHGCVRRGLEAGHARHPLGPHDHAIDGDTITLDAPITTAIEKQFGGATVEAYDWPGESRISASKTSHCNRHTTARIPTTKSTPGSASRCRTCRMPGSAASSFSTSPAAPSRFGKTRSGSRRGLHLARADLGTGRLSAAHVFHAGPTDAVPALLVRARAARFCRRPLCRRVRTRSSIAMRLNAHGDSGPIESWASGVLYDNVRIDGAGLQSGESLDQSARRRLVGRELRAVAMPGGDDARLPPADRQQLGDRRVGQVLPATARSPAQRFRQADEPVSGATPRAPSERTQLQRYRPGLVDPIGSTNPTLCRSGEIRRAIETAAAAVDRRDSREFRAMRVRTARRAYRFTAAAESNLPRAPAPERHAGNLRDQKRLARRRRPARKPAACIQQPFWRGTIRPDEAPQLLARAHALRARPRRHRDSPTISSKLPTTCSPTSVAVFDHHYGLWYDRRRDDHTMVRQADGDVAPPFYEQPFARTGHGHGLGRPEQVRPHEVQSVVLAAAARLRPAVRRARPRADSPELLPAQHSGSRRPLGRLPLAAGEQRERHGLSRAAAVHRRQADLHGAAVLRRERPAAPRIASRLHPPMPRQLRRLLERHPNDERRVFRPARVHAVLARHDHRMAARNTAATYWSP